MRKRLLRCAVMLAVLVSAGLVPCLADAPDAAPCPMAGCERTTSTSMDASCCCVTSEASSETSPGIFLPRPDPVAGGVAADHVRIDEAADDPIEEDRTTRLPDPVPLFLLHSCLLN